MVLAENRKSLFHVPVLKTSASLFIVVTITALVIFLLYFVHFVLQFGYTALVLSPKSQNTQTNKQKIAKAGN